jgi:hypothetical protein
MEERSGPGFVRRLETVQLPLSPQSCVLVRTLPKEPNGLPRCDDTVIISACRAASISVHLEASCRILLDPTTWSWSRRTPARAEHPPAVGHLEGVTLFTMSAPGTIGLSKAPLSFWKRVQSDALGGIGILY